ncbi:hypothetical protein ACLKMY_21055 [Paraburkholderia mimosarum]|uniref:hypothetical protein n=1 Tax=Paraburkholderia mimosarum TaxID=312026 RepID=UPI0039C4A56E
MATIAVYGVSGSLPLPIQLVILRNEMGASKSFSRTADLRSTPDFGDTHRARADAAVAVNAEDASAWRWFSALLEERRIRWRFVSKNWLIHVDKRHVATEPTFYDAIRAARNEADERGLGRL